MPSSWAHAGRAVIGHLPHSLPGRHRPPWGERPIDDATGSRRLGRLTDDGRTAAA